MPNRPAICSPRVPDSSGAVQADSRVEKGGGDPFGEVLQGVGGFCASAGGGVEVVQFIDLDEGDAGVHAHAANRVGDVGDVGPAREREPEEPGELHRDHLRGGRGRHGDINDRDVAARARVTAPVDHLDGLAELGQRGGLPGPGRTGYHQAAPPVVGVLVQLDQPAAGADDLADHRGLDHQQPGVVVDAVIVVAGAFARLQARPDRLGQQVRHRGHLGDEAAPARQGGQLQMLMLAGEITGRPGAGRAGHHGLSASANGSKIGIGITFASGASCSACPAAGPGCAGPPDSGWSCFPPGGVAALVRAATRRSRLPIFGLS